MSLTWKLALGFLFALVLQVVQMLVSGAFTSHLLHASQQVSAALAACLSAQAALDATREADRRVAGAITGAGPFDVEVARVFVDEVRGQVVGLAAALAAEDSGEAAAVRACLDRVDEHLDAVAAANHGGAGRRDELAFLADELANLTQALQRVQVRLRAVGHAGVEIEQSVRHLPMRAGIAVTLVGVVLMAAFVTWYSRQLAVPIQRAWAELEARVQDRTAALAAAVAAADAANRTKSAFLANISHELRTPMTAILGFADLGLEGAGAGDAGLQREALATIRRNGQSMVAIVSDLLDMAKLEAGKLAIERVACSPLAVVDEVVTLLRAKADARQVLLGIESRGELPLRIETDPLRLRQILVNLVDNAIKFAGGGSVTIAVEALAGAEPRLVFTVADTGVGMAPEVLARLFQPFEQADVSTTRRFGGTGLGLAISRQLARLLGGDIVASSVLGRGSTFRLSITAGKVAAMAAPAAAAPAATSSAATADDRALAGARVLLVEDGPDNQRLLRHLLERAGCRVEIAGDGQQCVDRCDGPVVPFDVVLMDMQMPVMDGLAATRVLRQRGVRLPIVALTANAMQADRDACLAAGCDAFLTKPIDRHLLLTTVARCRTGLPAPA
jgi:signal transduction histidine kinase/ActR/RegA family two-component response regulator